MARALGIAARQGPAAAADVAELIATTQRYEADLSLLGLSDDDLAHGPSPAGYQRRIGRSALDRRRSRRRWPPSARSSTSCPTRS